MVLLKSNSKAQWGQGAGREEQWAPHVICILPGAFRVLSLIPHSNPVRQMLESHLADEENET